MRYLPKATWNRLTLPAPLLPALSPLLGMAGALAFAPFHLTYLLPLGLALLFHGLPRLTPAQAFASGYGFGLGLLGLGLSWLPITLSHYGQLTHWQAGLLALLFVLLLSLYYGLAGWLICRLLMISGMATLVWIAPAVWVLLEWLRGWLFSGFPWLSSGYAMIDTPLAGFVPWLGLHGVSWLTVLMAASIAWTLQSPWQRRPWLLGIPLLLALGWGLGAIHWSHPIAPPFSVSLIQANIPQQQKWDRRYFDASMDRYLGLTERQWPSRLIIWPETAVSAFEHSVRKHLLDPLEQRARQRQRDLLIGVVIQDPASGRYFNALRNLGGNGAHYAKRHLVPFGEYTPFRDWLKPMLDQLGEPMADFLPGSLSRPLLTVAGHPAGVSICYEDLFGPELIQALPQAAFLVNVSNDAWFGDSIAPYQHLEMARMRALETARPLLRATNSGISAFIDSKGRILSQSGLLQTEVLQGHITPMAGTTPYVLLGDQLALSLLLLSLFGARLIGRAD